MPAMSGAMEVEPVRSEYLWNPKSASNSRFSCRQPKPTLAPDARPLGAKIRVVSQWLAKNRYRAHLPTSASEVNGSKRNRNVSEIGYFQHPSTTRTVFELQPTFFSCTEKPTHP